MYKEKTLKIVSDGTYAGTHVYTDDGKELLCRSVQWKIEPNGFASAIIEVLDTRIEVEMTAIKEKEK